MSRSQPGAGRQAEDLRAAGHEVVVAPVLDVEPTGAPVPPGPFDRIVFLSEHAVRFGLPALAPDTLAEAEVLAVGGRTAAVLAQHGLAAVSPQQATSEGLLELPRLRRLAGERILLVAGVGGRSLLAATLSARGAQVARFECYRRTVAAAVDPAVLECEAIVAASGDGLTRVAALWLGAGGRPDVPVLVPSERVAGRGVEVGLSSLHDCAGADSEAWLRGLERLQRTGTS